MLLGTYGEADLLNLAAVPVVKRR